MSLATEQKQKQEATTTWITRTAAMRVFHEPPSCVQTIECPANKKLKYVMPLHKYDDTALLFVFDAPAATEEVSTDAFKVHAAILHPLDDIVERLQQEHSGSEWLHGLARIFDYFSLEEIVLRGLRRARCQGSPLVESLYLQSIKGKLFLYFEKVETEAGHPHMQDQVANLLKEEWQRIVSTVSDFYVFPLPKSEPKSDSP